MGGEWGDQEPGHSSWQDPAGAPHRATCGAGLSVGRGERWPELRPVGMGCVGAHAGAIRQQWGWGTAFGEDSWAPEA